MRKGFHTEEISAYLIPVGGIAMLFAAWWGGEITVMQPLPTAIASKGPIDYGNLMTNISHVSTVRGHKGGGRGSRGLWWRERGEGREGGGEEDWKKRRGECIPQIGKKHLYPRTLNYISTCFSMLIPILIPRSHLIMNKVIRRITC